MPETRLWLALFAVLMLAFPMFPAGWHSDVTRLGDSGNGMGQKLDAATSGITRGFPQIWTSTEADNTYCVKWADINNDGYLDLAVGNYGQPDHIYNNNNGTLEDTYSWSSIEVYKTNDIAFADYDLDGDLDMAVAHLDGPDSIYRNDNGTLAISSTWESLVSDETYSVMWCDINNDGYPDLLTGGAYDRVYINRNGSIPETPDWEIPSTNITYSIAAGDMDNNGYMDLIVSRDFDYIHIYMNNNGTLENQPSWQSPEMFGEPYKIVVCNMDLDTYPDFFVAGRGEKNYFYRNANGSILPWWWSTETNSTLDIAVADIDNDDDYDLICSGELETVKIYRGDLSYDGNPTIGPCEQLGTQTYDGWGIDAADMDNDGDVEIALGVYGGANRVFVNNATENSAVFESNIWQSYWYSGETTSTSDLTSADINNDGYPDMVMTTHTQCCVYYNHNGTVETSPSWVVNDTSVPSALALGDYDLDGDLDMAVADRNGQNRIYRNDNGRFTDTAVWNSTESDISYDIAFGDINGDGYPDLAVANYGYNRIYFNRGGSIEKTASFNTSLSFRTFALSLSDIDCDGDLDMITGNEIFTSGPPYPNSINIYFNSGTELEKTPSWYSLVEYPYYHTYTIAVADLNNDDYPEIIAGHSYRWDVYNNSEGSLSPTPDYEVSDSGFVYSIAARDFNNDGYIDIAVGNNDKNRIYMNVNGTLSTTPFWESTTQTQTIALDWVDIDFDGDLDLAVGNGEPGSPHEYYDYIVLSHIVAGGESYPHGEITYPGAYSWLKGTISVEGRIIYPGGGPVGLNLKYNAGDGGQWPRTATVDDNRILINSTKRNFTFLWDTDADNLNCTDLTLKLVLMNYPYDSTWRRLYYTDVFPLTVTNYWPTYDGTLSSAVVIEDSTWSVDLDDHFSDLDDSDENLTYTWTYDGYTPETNKLLYNSQTHVVSWSPHGVNESITNLVFTATDPDGHWASSTPIILFYQAVNDPPVYVGGLNSTYAVEEDTTWSVDLDSLFYDEESDNELVFLCNRSEVNIDPISHVATWEPQHGDSSLNHVVFTAMDPEGLYASSQEITLEYQEVNDEKPVYIGGLTDAVVHEDSTWSIDLDSVFYDEESNPDLDDSSTLIYSTSNKNISIDPDTHIATWSPGHGNSTQFNVIFTATDPENPSWSASSMPVTLYYVEENDNSPVYTGGLQDSYQVYEDQTWSIDLDDYFYDEESDQILLFKSSHPGIIIDPTTHVASWTPRHGDTTLTNVVFTAIDPQDPARAATSPPITLYYVEVNDQRPVYTGGLNDAYVEEDSTWSIDLDSIFYDEESNPYMDHSSTLIYGCNNGNITINTTTHIASWTPRHGDTSLVNVVFTATDPENTSWVAGSMAITLYYVEVNDQPPVYTGGLERTYVVSEDTTWSIDLDSIFYDEESNGSLRFSCSSAEVTIDIITHIAFWTPRHGDTTLTNVVFTAIDPENTKWTADTPPINLTYMEVNDQPPVYTGGLSSSTVMEDTMWYVDLDEYFYDEEGAVLEYSCSSDDIAIDNTTHIASWTPVHGSSTLNAVYFIASDGLYTAETPPITLTYMEVNDAQPVYLGGLENVSAGNERVWKADLDEYFYDEENNGKLIFSCNKPEVVIDPLTHEAMWSPTDPEQTELKDVVFTAYDPDNSSQVVSTESMTLRVAPVPPEKSDDIITVGPFGLNLWDITELAFSIITFLIGLLLATRKARRTNAHRKRIDEIRDIKELRRYYEEEIRPDIVKNKVTPVQALILKDAVEERAIELKGVRGMEVALPPDAQTQPSKGELEEEILDEEEEEEEDEEEDEDADDTEEGD